MVRAVELDDLLARVERPGPELAHGTDAVGLGVTVALAGGFTHGRARPFVPPPDVSEDAEDRVDRRPGRDGDLEPGHAPTVAPARGAVSGTGVAARECWHAVGAMEPSLPLAGVRVIDLTTFLSGPMATHTLGELGAEIIKVEPPAGDPTRGPDPTAPASPFWVALHRDRRSVVLDLKQDAGVAVLRELVARADVLIENFRPGVTTRLAITDADLRPGNPRLIYCSLTGYGADGPSADQPATDGPIQAFAGALELTGAPVPLTVGDISGAAHGVQAITAALYARERSGRGCHIELSLAECLMQWLAVTDRSGTLAPPTTLVLAASDGPMLLIQTPMHMRARFLSLVGEVAGCEAWATDARWSSLEGQRAALDEYVAGAARAIAARPAAAWLAALSAAGIPAAVVRTIEGAMSDPDLARRGAAGDLDVAGVGPARIVRSPFVIDGQRRRETAPPPALGEHTEEVLRDVLGYDDERIAATRAAGGLGR